MLRTFYCFQTSRIVYTNLRSSFSYGKRSFLQSPKAALPFTTRPISLQKYLERRSHSFESGVLSSKATSVSGRPPPPFLSALNKLLSYAKQRCSSRSRRMSLESWPERREDTTRTVTPPSESPANTQLIVDLKAARVVAGGRRQTTRRFCCPKSIATKWRTPDAEVRSFSFAFTAIAHNRARKWCAFFFGCTSTETSGKRTEENAREPSTTPQRERTVLSSRSEHTAHHQLNDLL